MNLKPILFLVLVGLGIAGMRYNVTLFFGVDFVFGSIATFLILALLGGEAALFASILIGSYTIVLWGHFYILLAMIAEIVFVSLLLKRARYNITLAAGFYWITLGIPIIFLSYYLSFDFSWDRALMAATKHAINGIFNAVIASLILEQSPLSKIPQLRYKRNRTVFQTVFNVFVAAAVIPSFAILVLDSRKVAEQATTSVQLRLETISASLILFADRWKDQHIAMVELVAHSVEEMRHPTPEKMQQLVQRFRKASSDLASLSITNANGKVLAFDPILNSSGRSMMGTDYSNFDSFTALKTRLHNTLVAPVRRAGAVIPEPVVTVSTAILSDGKFQGVASAALDLTKLTNVLNTTGNDTNYYATIVDSEGRVVSSNNPALLPSDQFKSLEFDPLVSLLNSNFYQRWPNDKGISSMARWVKSSIGIVSPLGDDGQWRLYVEIPMGDQHNAIYHQYGRAMGMLLVLILFILAASHWLATMIGDPLTKLSTQTTNLPQRLSSQKKSLKELLWPQSEFQEVKTLVDNIRGMNIELRQRFQELEMANRMKDEFLATLSHELRTPLNVIIGHTEVLKQQTAAHKIDDKQILQSIDAISRNASIQNQLVSDLLDISAIITGKIAFQPSLVSLSELSRNVVDGLKLSAEAKGIHLKVEIDDGLCTVIGDSTRLHQVIWNLLSNAIKFTPRDGNVVVKTYAVHEGSEPTCVFEVMDSGRGIEPDFLPYIFERFRQEDSTTTRKFGGLGLGLSIVRHITELHGGTVLAVSLGKGQGASFKVTLPYSASPPPAPATVVAAEIKNIPLPATPVTETSTEDALENLSLLVIDDDTDSRELLQFVLHDAGAKVMTAANTRDALEIARSKIFDLIISDIGLPDEDGYTLIRKLRNDLASASRTRPAIALTAYARDEDRIKCLEAGFQAYLSKPVDIQKLIQMIRQHTSESPKKTNA